MKKNIIISTSVILTILIISTLTVYFKNKNSNVAISSQSIFVSDDSYDEAYSDIQYNGTDLATLANEVSKKIEIQNKYVKLNKLNSNITNINDEKVTEALNSLVNENTNSVNSYNPNDSTSKIEFNLVNTPNVNATTHAEGIDDFSYEIRYMSNQGLGGINFVNNTSLINDTISEDYSVRIFFIYKTDTNYEMRTQIEEKLNNQAHTAEEIKSEQKRIEDYYTPKMKFEQGIEFRMNGLKFNDTLKLPATINIWNEYSPALYPCKLTKNTLLPSGYNAYHIMYSCERLPNVNDYTGDLKILFD